VREAVTIYERLLSRGQMKNYMESYAARSYAVLGQVLNAAGQTREAQNSYRKAVTLLNGLVKQLPYSAYARLDLAQTLNGLADLLTQPNQRQEAEELRTRAIGHYEKLRANSFEHPAVNNELAWLLATSPEPRLRNPAHAVELAKKAVGAWPESATYRNTLGVAHYRNGDDKAAVAELEKARSLRAGGDGFDWFFLAMAHWRLGNRDQARTWLDGAVQWMNTHQPHNDELRRFRAEAEAMLSEGEEGEC
jgi:tetratricopeptide (TPR) repeat protein